MFEIVEYPHPFLRYKCKPLKKVDASIREVAEEMLQVMHQEQGTGLAAPQIQMPFRLITVCHEKSNYVFINPTITRTKSKSVVGREGCLSFTDLVLPIRRKQKIRFQGWTLDGDDIDEVVSGNLARTLQHEVDHLDGNLFIDKLGNSPGLQKKVVPYLRASEFAYQQHGCGVNTDEVDELLEQYC